MEQFNSQQPRRRRRPTGEPSGAWQPPKLPFMPGGSKSSGAKDSKGHKGRIRRIFTRKRLAIGAAVITAFLIFTPLITYAYYARDISDRERLMNRNNTGVVLKDKKGEVFYQSGQINGDNDVKLSQISDHLEKALIASEDKNFYEHGGYSIRGIAGALYGNVLNRDSTRYGGSTLTQQLVKNNLLSAEKNYLRKYQEVSMAVAVERNYTKDEILEMYLNSVYYGEGAFGVSDAAKTYFGKNPADLTIAESAMLVGLLPAPNTYSPINGDAALGDKQQVRVLSKMVEEGYITADDKKQAEATDLIYAGGSSDDFDHAQHYALMVMDQLNEEYGEERVSRSGFTVTTTLDLAAQKQAEAIVQKRVATFTAGGGRNASLVAIDPKTGQVQALVGSVDWNNTEFGKVNMAISPRQPGSSFKPIYFAEAIDKKLVTAATILRDERRTFGEWKPENFDFRFKGDMPVRNALAESRNIPAALVMEKLGPTAASRAAQRMGITTVTEPEKYGLTLALGTAETELFEMTNAYAAFANRGQQFEPVLYTGIQDKYERSIFQHEQRDGNRIISAESAFVLSSILSDPAARAPTFGSSLNISGREVALKTGTTDENKDAWTIGYTPSLAVGVWVGNNESQPMRGLAGGSSAGVIWREAMTGMVSSMPQEKFAVPAGVNQLQVCRGTGQRAASAGSNTYTEYFVSGSEPTGQCNAAKPAEEKKEEKKKEEEPKVEDQQDNQNEGDEEDQQAPANPTTPVAPTTPVTPTPAPNPTQPLEGGRGQGEEPPDQD